MLRKRRPLDAAIDDAFWARAALAPRDAGFARAIAGETLRRFGQLDALIRAFVPKPPPPHKAGPTLELLLAGACELLFLDVPAHAAVDAANRLAMRDAKAKHFKPLINAVLRRMAREGARRSRRAGCRAPQHAGLAVDALVRGLWRRDGARDRRMRMRSSRRSIW